MSHLKVKAKYESEGAFGSTEEHIIYCHHNNTCDIVSFMSHKGEVMTMVFQEWSTGKDLWDIMLILMSPYKDKWFGELKEGVKTYKYVGEDW